jgi:hypothetical protein
MLDLLCLAITPAVRSPKVRLGRMRCFALVAPIAGKDHGGIIEEGEGLHSRDCACHGAHDHGDHRACHRQFEGIRKSGGDLSGHRYLGDDGVAQVAMQKAVHETKVLDCDGLVEAHISTYLLDILLGCPLVRQELGGVAWHQPDHEKDDQRYS